MLNVELLTPSCRIPKKITDPFLALPPTASPNAVLTFTRPWLCDNSSCRCSFMARKYCGWSVSRELDEGNLSSKHFTEHRGNLIAWLLIMRSRFIGRDRTRAGRMHFSASRYIYWGPTALWVQHICNTFNKEIVKTCSLPVYFLLDFPSGIFAPRAGGFLLLNSSAIEIIGTQWILSWVLTHSMKRSC